MVVVLSLLLVAAIATLAVLRWPHPAPSAANPTIRSVVPMPTVAAVDPRVTAPAAEIKPLSVSAGKVATAPAVGKRLAPALANKALAQYTGIVLDGATGKVLWSKEPSKATQPASTLKLLTGAALLIKVDSDPNQPDPVRRGVDGFGKVLRKIFRF